MPRERTPEERSDGAPSPAPATHGHQARMLTDITPNDADGSQQPVGLAATRDPCAEEEWRTVRRQRRPARAAGRHHTACGIGQGPGPVGDRSRRRATASAARLREFCLVTGLAESLLRDGAGRRHSQRPEAESREADQRDQRGRRTPVDETAGAAGEFSSDSHWPDDALRETGGMNKNGRTISSVRDEPAIPLDVYSSEREP